MIITNRELCNQKMKSLKNGYNAFAESEKLIRLIEKEIEREKIDVIFDKTSAGCWIIPAPALEKTSVIH